MCTDADSPSAPYRKVVEVHGRKRIDLDTEGATVISQRAADRRPAALTKVNAPPGGPGRNPY